MKVLLVASVFLCFLSADTLAQSKPQHNLSFSHLATRWDEAMPLGNGMLGALVWQKNGRLRLSLDRADLWDERQAMDLSKFTFKDVVQHVYGNDYDTIHTLGDAPYDNVVYPTKLPAAALEFPIDNLDSVVSNELDVATAVNSITFGNGVVFRTYIHATQPIGVFRFENIKDTADFAALLPQLMIHNYNNNTAINTSDNSHAGEGLQKLGYAKGSVVNTNHSVLYHQPTCDKHYFEVLVQWKRINASTLAGSWTISNDKPASLPPITKEGMAASLATHINWWKNFWAKSSLSIPDTLIEKQYYLEQYKLGCVARKGAPAITLQAVWTADNGSLPPWKGDFHNDLNTQLSYWSSYTGNHLAEAATYTDWLWKIKTANEQYTKQYFGVGGLNVPGVVTLNGYPMGGWIQYSLSPTVVAWCAQHMYWQWKYSMDENFLSERAYPYLHEAAVYLENITQVKNGKRFLPLSSSPEYNDNNITAWFKDWTNFDLSLTKNLFASVAEICLHMNKTEEAQHWQTMLNELPGFNVNETGLTVAPGEPPGESHRHMSPYMAIYPLALLDVNNSEEKSIIEHSLHHIELLGTKQWCGYSFAWMSCLYARAYEGDSAAKQLRIFASNFCSPNSFHLNGDQKGGQYSSYTYRPFTLEGNFAFAQGVQELLLQSRKDYIEVFPALPSSWQNVSFHNLLAEGAFLISAEKKENDYTITVTSRKEGILKIKLPFQKPVLSIRKDKIATKENTWEWLMEKGESIIIKNR